MDLDQLAALIDLCRAKGVASVETGGVKLVLGAPPAPAQTAGLKSPEPPAPPATPVSEIEGLERRLLKGRRFVAEVTKS